MSTTTPQTSPARVDLARLRQRVGESRMQPEIIAACISMPPAQLQDIIDGKVTPTVDQLGRIATQIGASVGWLSGDPVAVPVPELPKAQRVVNPADVKAVANAPSEAQQDRRVQLQPDPKAGFADQVPAQTPHRRLDEGLEATGIMQMPAKLYLFGVSHHVGPNTLHLLRHVVSEVAPSVESLSPEEDPEWEAFYEAALPLAQHLARVAKERGVNPLSTIKSN